MSIRRPFEPAPASVAAARRFVATTLADAGLDTPAILKPALVAVSELATNAVVHARTRFEVEVDTTPSVRITVIDGSAIPRNYGGPSPCRRADGAWPWSNTTASRWGVEQEAGGSGRGGRWTCPRPSELIR